MRSAQITERFNQLSNRSQTSRSLAGRPAKAVAVVRPAGRNSKLPALSAIIFLQLVRCVRSGGAPALRSIWDRLASAKRAHRVPAHPSRAWRATICRICRSLMHCFFLSLHTGIQVDLRSFALHCMICSFFLFQPCFCVQIASDRSRFCIRETSRQPVDLSALSAS